MLAYDVIVVGGGPGGASAAYHLTHAGARVLVLDQARFPRYKTCGGAVPRSVLQYFPFDFAGVLSAQVAQVRYCLANGHRVSVPTSERPIAMFMRDKFDTFLLGHCEAEVRDGCAVRQVTEEPESVRVVTEQGEVIQARYLVGADGAKSVVAHQLGLPHARRFGGAIEVEASAPPHLLTQYSQTALFEFGAVPNGYLWIFPKADHLSVGIGAMSATHAPLKDILWREMKRLGLNLDGAVAHAHPIPVYPGHKRFNTRRCLLVGDAAGLADGLIGEGIRYAIQSGQLAAESILRDKIADYSWQVRRRIGGSLTWANLGALIFYSLPEVCFYVGAANPRSTKGFVATLNDRHSYGWLFTYILGCATESLMTFKWLRPMIGGQWPATDSRQGMASG
jgi:geranylgeranyl reductase family protein